MPDLKPCPFCGGKASEYFNYGGQTKYRESYYFFYIQCLDCGARSKATSGVGNPDEDYPYRIPASYWNRRTPE